MLVTIIAVLDSRQYQYTHSALYELVKLRCLLKMAQMTVKNPKENGKIRRSFRLVSNFAFISNGRGIDMTRISLVRLNTKFVMRWFNAVVHCAFFVGVFQ